MSDPPGKPKNTAVGSVSVLQGIFPTQESNRGLLHCRWILYQLSYQGAHSVVLVSAIQRASAVKYTHVPSLWQLPPTSSRPSSWHRVLGWTPCVTQQLPTICLTHGGVGVRAAVSVPPSLSLPCGVHKSASLLLPCKEVHRNLPFKRWVLKIKKVI